jgi:large subunit ribosomal protein L18
LGDRNVLPKHVRKSARWKRRRRVRKKLFGSPEMPRFCVYRSNRHVYSQIIDDTVGRTMVSASTMDKELRGDLKMTGNMEAAVKVGKIVAKRAVEKGIQRVAFDRNFYLYHGKVRALADSAREEGLQF